MKLNMINNILFLVIIWSGIIFGQGYKITGSQVTSGQVVSSSGLYKINSSTSSQTSFASSSDSFSVSQGMIGVIQTLSIVPPDIYVSMTDTIFQTGMPINVIGVLKDLNGVASANLHLQKGGSSKEISLPMFALNDSTYEVSIHDSLVTINNFRAYVRGVDNLENTGNSKSFYPSIIYGANELNTNIDGSIYPDGVPSKKWRMISFPGSVNDSIINNAKGNGYTFYVWNNLEMSWDSPSVIKPGKAYWFKHIYDSSFPFKSDSGTVLPLRPYEIRLDQGWNMIGNPFANSVNVRVDSSEVSNLYFFGDSTNRDGWEVSSYQMMPWAGYAIYSTSESSNITLLPFSDEIESRSSNRTMGLEWVIQFSAKTQHNFDNVAMIGRKKHSHETKDSFDIPLLPKIEEGINVAFSIDESNVYNYSSDFRSVDEVNGVWDLSIISEQASNNVDFSISENANTLPTGIVLALLDIQTRKVYYDFLLNSIMIRSNKNLGYEFKVIVGEPEFVQSAVAEILAIIPSEFALSKNYPNPFNPITHLDYSLPKRSQVRLRIYNMVGQEIITLINEEKQYGNYSISWNGIDSKGRNVASGVYFAELRSNDKSSVTKMLLLK